MHKGKKRVHRLVVLPDYQGIGIGTKFIKEIAKIVTSEGFELNLMTTTPALVGALKKDSDWTLARFGREKCGMKGFEKYSSKRLGHLQNATSKKRVTYSFWYKEK